MTIERINKGPRMTQAVVHNGVVYISGQVAFDAPYQSIEEQARNTLSYIDKQLAAAGSDKTKLMMANIWLTDIRDYDRFNAVWDEWLDPENAPARATVEARLAAPQYNIEISVIAARK
jgi:enamine deaminase RidA (YjgF/YER057c/UK114 family)